MLLKDFLLAFVGGLNREGIEHCILRNYESLPDNNIGNDIDFLIPHRGLPSAVTVISAIENVCVTGFIQRPHVTSIFIYGVIWGGGRQAIQVDLISSLCWKGLPYLSAEKVLSNSISVSNCNGLLKKPAIYDEAINTFFSSYLVGGWIKDRYQSMVKGIFSKNRESVISVLSEIFTSRVAESVVDNVISDDRDALLRLLPTIKRDLLVSGFIHRPFKTIAAIFKYYLCEIKMRFTPYPLDTICFLGPDGSGKSTVISGIVSGLEGATKSITISHLKPLHRGSTHAEGSTVEDPHSKPTRSATFSILKIIYWVFLYWKDRYLHGQSNLTLRIWDRYFYDVYIDPRRYRFGAPLWAAKLIGELVPKPGLIIVLDSPAEVIQARKQEVSYEETIRQRAAYLEFAANNPNCVVLDTSVNIDETVKVGRASVLKYMAKRQKFRLKAN